MKNILAILAISLMFTGMFSYVSAAETLTEFNSQRADNLVGEYNRRQGGHSNPSGSSTSSIPSSDVSVGGFITCYGQDGEKLDVLLRPYVVAKTAPLPSVKTIILGNYKVNGFEWRVRVIDGKSLPVIDRFCDGSEEGLLFYNHWVRKVVHPDFW